MILIAKNTVVTLSYDVFDSDGEAIETDGRMAYLHGGYAGIFPKVEEALAGKTTGATCELSLDPGDAFGDYDENLLRIEPASVFPPELQVGMQFEGVPPGEDDDRWLVYTVTDIAEGQVVLDGNHPLAGERLLFKCRIDQVRDASAEEIAHGHPHGEHGIAH